MSKTNRVTRRAHRHRRRQSGSRHVMDGGSKALRAFEKEVTMAMLTDRAAACRELEKRATAACETKKCSKRQVQGEEEK